MLKIELKYLDQLLQKLLKNGKVNLLKKGLLKSTTILKLSFSKPLKTAQRILNQKQKRWLTLLEVF